MKHESYDDDLSNDALLTSRGTDAGQKGRWNRDNPGPRAFSRTHPRKIILTDHVVQTAGCPLQS